MSKIQRYVPLRRCMACNEQKEKGELIRIVKSKDGKLEIDLSGKKNGRGYYVCTAEECVNKLEKPKYAAGLFKNGITEEQIGIIKETAAQRRKNGQ